MSGSTTELVIGIINKVWFAAIIGFSYYILSYLCGCDGKTFPGEQLDCIKIKLKKAWDNFINFFTKIGDFFKSMDPSTWFKK